MHPCSNCACSFPLRKQSYQRRHHCAFTGDITKSLCNKSHLHSSTHPPIASSFFAKPQSPASVHPTTIASIQLTSLKERRTNTASRLDISSPSKCLKQPPKPPPRLRVLEVTRRRRVGGHTRSPQHISADHHRPQRSQARPLCIHVLCQ